MAGYELRRYRRQTGAPAWGESIETFEAADDASARTEAYRRTRSLSAGYFATLHSATDDHLGSYEAQDA